jgi:hypothetical protein
MHFAPEEEVEDRQARTTLNNNKAATPEVASLKTNSGSKIVLLFFMLGCSNLSSKDLQRLFYPNRS